MALDVHEVTNGNDDLLDLLCEFSGGGEDQSLAGLELRVDLLKARDRESGSLSSSRLGLRDDIGPCRIASDVVTCRKSDDDIYP